MPRRWHPPETAARLLLATERVDAGADAESTTPHALSTATSSAVKNERRIFGMPVAAVGDIALAPRGRGMGFIFSHQERVLFLHVFLAFGVDVVSMLLTPRIRTRSEIHRIAKSVCGMYTERLKELFVLGRGEWRNDANNVGFVIDCTVGADYGRRWVWGCRNQQEGVNYMGAQEAVRVCRDED